MKAPQHQAITSTNVEWMLQELRDQLSKLVPRGTKPLPEPMLIEFYDTIWCH